MVFTSMTITAMQVAYTKHAGQVDKAGVPYIFHPYHLAEQLQDEIACTVALLHDVVEDTDTTFEELSEKFPDEVIEALRFLTRTKDTPYLEYVKNIKKNKIATAVKLKDLEHNMEKARMRLTHISDKKRKSLFDRYTKAVQILTE